MRGVLLPKVCVKCPQVGHEGMFSHITSKWLQTYRYRVAWCTACINEVEMCIGQGFSWVSVLNMLVSARACAYQNLPCQYSGIVLSARQVNGWMPTLTRSRMPPYMLVYGVRKGVGGYFGPMKRFSVCQKMYKIHRQNTCTSLRSSMSTFVFLVCSSSMWRRPGIFKRNATPCSPPANHRVSFSCGRHDIRHVLMSCLFGVCKGKRTTGTWSDL